MVRRFTERKAMENFVRVYVEFFNSFMDKILSLIPIISNNSNMPNQSKPYAPITIPNVLPSIKRDLENIAANMGITLTTFLKVEFKKIIDSYPSEKKKQVMSDHSILVHTQEIRIPNVKPSVKRDLENVAANMGVGLSTFLKSELSKIADSYSKENKTPIKD